ncbi:MAG: ABC transporter permease [Vicinamibacterales bacterium]
MLNLIAGDLRLAVRTLAARPGWTGAAIICLGIATGANTAAFTLVNGLLLRPLPFEQPEQLVMVALRDPQQALTRPFALDEYRRVVREADVPGMLLARTFFPLSLAAGDGARMAQAELVSGNYFDTLGVKPFLGTFFDESDDRQGSALLAVLSHTVWRLRFGADPGIVAQTVRVNGRAVTIAGVAPPGFVGATQLVTADLWLPAIMYSQLADSPRAAEVPMFGVMARLEPQVTRDEAAARLTSAFADSPHPVAVVIAPASGFGVPIAVAGSLLNLSALLYVVMGLLTAVACANVAALVLARGAGRSGEIAIRLGLGASRTRIARQLLAESAVLALAGCLAGIFAALWLTRALVAALPTGFQYVSYAINVEPDLRVFTYSALATLATVLLCGIAPIRLAARVDVLEMMKQSSARGRPRESLRALHTLVVAQLAVSTMLLVAAATVGRSYFETRATRTTIDTEGLLVAALDLEQLRLDRASGSQLYQNAMERLSAIPGVAAVALTRDVPFRPGRSVTVIADAGGGVGSSDAVLSDAMLVSSGYFQTVGLTLRQGRALDRDTSSQPLATLVNEAMAKRVWPGVSPLGRTFKVGAEGQRHFEVIGVVSDMTGTAELSPRPAFYQLFPHEYSARMTIVIRAHGEPQPLVPEVQRTIRAVDPDLAIVDLRTMEDLLRQLSQQRRAPALALTVVAILALFLSGVGLYGVIAYGVRLRGRELGVRPALGATPGDVRRLVLRQGAGFLAAGLVIGVAASVTMTQLARSRWLGLGAVDPVTLAIVCGVLMAVGCSALYLPARWASSVEPAQTLRSD